MVSPRSRAPRCSQQPIAVKKVPLSAELRAKLISGAGVDRLRNIGLASGFLFPA
jgi:hypothetical protein